MAWIYMMAAALFEIVWVFSLKFLSFKKIGTIQWRLFFKNADAIVTLTPLLAYIIFGLANVYFLALSMKQISTSLAFAVWTAVSVVGVRLAEIIFYKEPYSLREFFFLALIVVGIIGLKKS